MSSPRTRPLIRAFLIDVSGNLHVGTRPTPNAVEAFHRLRASGIPFRLCSNTSKESTSSLVRRLNKIGFDVETPPGLAASGSTPDSATGARDHPSLGYQRQARKEVWTSIGAVAQYIQSQGFKRPYLILTPSAKEEVTSVLSGGLVDEYSDSPYDSVVVGLAPELLDYFNINTAFRILKGEQTSVSRIDRPQKNASRGSPSNPLLVATHKAKYIQTEDPVGLSLGPGPFVTALETAADVQAQVIGKPTRLFFETVIENFYTSGELEQAENHGKIAVIGDDVETDLGDGAIEMGLWRILVKTGKYRSGDEDRTGIIAPDEVFDSFSACVERILTEQDSDVSL